MRLAPAVAVLATALGMVVSIPHPAQGQEPTSAWATVGLGGSIYTSGSELLDDGAGLVAVGGVSYQTGAHVLSLRGSIVAELFDDALADVGLLYGRGSYRADRHASIAAGLAWVHSEECPGGLFSSGPCTTENTIGVPIVAEGSLRPTSFLGLGIQAFANLNAARSVAGLAVFVELGSLY